MDLCTLQVRPQGRGRERAKMGAGTGAPGCGEQPGAQPGRGGSPAGCPGNSLLPGQRAGGQCSLQQSLGGKGLLQPRTSPRPDPRPGTPRPILPDQRACSGDGLTATSGLETWALSPPTLWGQFGLLVPTVPPLGPHTSSSPPGSRLQPRSSLFPSDPSSWGAAPLSALPGFVSASVSKAHPPRFRSSPPPPLSGPSQSPQHPPSRRPRGRVRRE